MYSETINSDAGPNNHHKTLIDIPYHFISHYYIILGSGTNFENSLVGKFSQPPKRP